MSESKSGTWITHEARAGTLTPRETRAAVWDYPAVAYYQRLIYTFGSSTVGIWPIADTGAAIDDASPNNLDGAFKGTIASKGNLWYGGAYASLTNGFVDLYGVAFLAAMSKTEFTINCFVMPTDWTQADYQYEMQFQTDASNYIRMRHSSAGNLEATYMAGGTQKAINVGCDCWSTAQMTMLTFTVSATNNRSSLYVNGGYVLGLTGLGTHSGGAIDSRYCGFGGFKNATTFTWPLIGGISNCSIFNRELNAAEVLSLHVSTLPIISFLGDSIALYTSRSSWPLGIATEKNYRVINHAVSAKAIMSSPDGMDDQTAAAATDGASIIIIELGTNDVDDAGITAKYAADVAALKVSNPGATIYGMGILNKTTETYRTTNNARISTACTNAGITYWDTEGWITAAIDTVDGLHPNNLGAAKIVTQILARI
jgi:hypothetical protein